MPNNQMTKFNYNPKNLTGINFGTHINDFAKQALAIANQENRLVKFDFNGIMINVTPNMCAFEIVASYSKKLDYSGYLYMNSAQGMKEKIISKLVNMKTERKNKETLASISGEIFDTKYNLFWEDWKSKNTDPYGAGIFRFAENWANLMQKEIKTGKELTRELVEQTHYAAADLEGISGFMYDCAKSLLVSSWNYGLLLGKLLEVDYDKIIESRRIAGLKNANLLKAKQQQSGVHR